VSAQGRNVWLPKLPLIDLLVIGVMLVAGGFVWFQTLGKARLTGAHAEVLASQAENSAEIRRAEEDSARAQQELTRKRAERDAKARDVVALVALLQDEERRIGEARLADGESTDQLLALRTDLSLARERRADVADDIAQTERQLEESRQAVALLSVQVAERDLELERLEARIDAAQAELQANPPSRFPEESSLSSMLEISDLGNPDKRYVLSLARRVKTLGGLDLGLVGSLGLGSDAGDALKEGGVFANLPLAPRRASLSLEGGISQLQSRSSDEQQTGPFAGATLRFAPLRRERLFLLAGTRYGHEDLALRFGLGLGGR
jgi:hypothetical protein